jgi:hypothetical protein
MKDLPQICSNYGASRQGSLGQALVIKNREDVPVMLQKVEFKISLIGQVQVP